MKLTHRCCGTMSPIPPRTLEKLVLFLPCEFPLRLAKENADSDWEGLLLRSGGMSDKGLGITVLSREHTVAMPLGFILEPWEAASFLGAQALLRADGTRDPALSLTYCGLPLVPL